MGRVLILEADQFCADMLRQIAARAFPQASLSLVNRVSLAAAMIAIASVDLLLTGLYLPDGDIIDFLAASLGQIPFPRVLVVTACQEQWVLQSLRQLAVEGVFDTVSEGGDQLGEALRTVAMGCSYWSAATLEHLRRQRAAPNAYWRLLTPSEQRILAVIGDGCDDQSAAERLQMKPSSVQSARREIHRKLGVQHKGDLVQLAVQNGFVRFGPAGVSRPGFSILQAACHQAKRDLKQ